MHVVACQKCGAGLPPPDAYGHSSCGFCATLHASPAHMAEEAARIPMTDESVLSLLRQHFAGADSMYLCPNVPPKKEHSVRRAHVGYLPTNEWILALYDDTVFGSGEDGFIVTSRRLCWKNVADRPRMVEWQDLDPEKMYADGRKLLIGAGAIEISGDESVIDACADAFHILALSARPQRHAPIEGPGSRAPRSHVPTLESAVAPVARAQSSPAYATPPTPPVPSFACWHCRTPLYWNTPQCARCSAWPTPQGWLRTG